MTHVPRLATDGAPLTREPARGGKRVGRHLYTSATYRDGSGSPPRRRHARPEQRTTVTRCRRRDERLRAVPGWGGAHRLVSGNARRVITGRVVRSDAFDAAIRDR